MCRGRELKGREEKGPLFEDFLFLFFFFFLFFLPCLVSTSVRSEILSVTPDRTREGDERQGKDGMERGEGEKKSKKKREKKKKRKKKAKNERK
jgi:hypothetical protein